MSLSSRPISYVMGAFNSASTIAESIGSIMDGNFESGDEIIVVNDGSTDDTLRVLENVKSRYPSIKIIDCKENRGGPAARNIGCRAAINPIIFNLDSDNLLVPGSVSRLKSYIISERADAAAFSSARYFQYPGKITHRWVYVPGIFTLADLLAGDINPGPGGNYMFTKELWSKVGGFWEYGKGLHDTWGFTLKILSEGARMVVMPDSYYLHRYGHDSLFMRESRKTHESSKIATKMMLNYLHLLHEEDANYIAGEGADIWYDGPNRRPIRVKGGIIGRVGYIERPLLLRAKIWLAKTFPGALDIYFAIKKKFKNVYR